MNGCIQCLSQEYSRVRFCKITAHDAKLSRKFVSEHVTSTWRIRVCIISANHMHLVVRMFNPHEKRDRKVNYNTVLGVGMVEM